MNSERERLQRIVDLARKGQGAAASAASPVESLEPPPGFATRVAARWAASPRPISRADVWERISWWGSGLATAACLFVVVFHETPPEPTGFDLLMDAPDVEQQLF